MKQVGHIFVDEMKNGSLPAEENCNNNYYVFSAVVVSDEHLQAMRAVHAKIISKHFKQAGVLKSKSIARKGVWLDIANSLKEVAHYVSYLAVDRSKLDGEGFRNSKWSFHKYFQSLINKRFLDLYEEAHVTFDQTGTSRFQESLKAYMQEKGFEKNLFENNSFEIKEDKAQEPLLQIADFYAGIVGRYYRNAAVDAQMGMNEIYDSIRDRVLPLHFPYTEISLRIAEGLSKDEFNPQIFKIAVDSAKRFLDAYKDKETECEIVSLMLDEVHKNPLRFVSSKEIAKILRLKYNKDKVNPTITIGGIRDKGVLIVSQKQSNSGGYKLPCNEAEVHGFYNSFTLNIIPQLRRIGIMNNVLIENSDGTINVLAHEDKKVLSELVDKARDKRLNFDDPNQAIIN